MTRYPIDRINQALKSRTGDWVNVLLPGAKLSGSHYRAGSVRGEPGTSLVIDASTGIWFDHATGQKGDPLALIMEVLELSFPKALDWAQAQLEAGVIETPVVPAKPKRVFQPLRHHNWSDLVRPQRRDINQLCRNLQIGGEGLRLALRRGLLWLSGNRAVITDSARYVRADRNLDGSPVRLSSGSVTKSRTLGFATWPVGVSDLEDRKSVILTEGFSDFLAGHHLLVTEGVQKYVSVCAMLGAATRIHPEALEHFSGRNVLIFYDSDKAGKAGARRWLDQLNPHCRCIQTYWFKDLRRDDGEPVKDLRDFLRVHVDDWEADPEVTMPVTHFLRKVL